MPFRVDFKIELKNKYLLALAMKSDARLIIT